jgi:hypothetical protein
MRRPASGRGWRDVACYVTAAALLVGFAATAEGARAEEGDAAPRIVVDGTDWIESTSIQRQAFLVGVANMIVAETAYAKRHGAATPPVSEKITAAVSEMKLDEIEARISRWYEANPDRIGMPVMGVVWKDIVGR